MGPPKSITSEQKEAINLGISGFRETCCPSLVFAGAPVASTMVYAPFGPGSNSSGVVLHLSGTDVATGLVRKVTAYEAPSKAPRSQACPCRFCLVIPSTCPLRIMLTASIP